MDKLVSPHFILAMLLTVALIVYLFCYNEIDSVLSSMVLLVIGYYFGKETTDTQVR